MDIQEVKEYNKIVIEVAAEMSEPWKWSTVVLSLLLAGMIALYFLNPTGIDVDQTFDATNSTSIVNNQKG